MVTELKPDLRKLPFDEFVNMMCRPMVDRDALESELAATFPTFSGGNADITPSTLQSAMADLGRPVDRLVSEEMIREASSGSAPVEGKVSRAEFCAMNAITRHPGTASGGSAAVDVM
uniref:EF-hand domain-containing protein n=1 Tax=Haptolina brevifila TaxID=156173 RepID=A0A7S2E159_9EUKA|mmetsp:Transcript_46952/g.93551  ORF Transcript_46952/g.93551 Transcript_46952/m.93551 type:complete len:117 (+) Transcript_46952:111-461(+)